MSSAAPFRLVAKRQASLRAMSRTSLELLIMQQLVRGSLSDIDVGLASPGSEDGTLGMLEKLTEELIILVLINLPTHCLIKVCSVLCKRMRALKYNMDLWHSLKVGGFRFGETGLRQLEHWLPDCGAVRSLELTPYSFRSWGDAPAAEFVASFGALERLKLTGDLKAQFMACLGRLKFESVREFHFEPPGSLGAKHSHKLVSAMPQLRILKLNERQLTDNLLLISAMSPKPLLEELHQVGGAYWNEGLTVEGLARIGRAYPRLRVLKVSMAVLQWQRMLIEDGELATGGRLEIAPMTNLEELHLRQLCPPGGPHLPSDVLSKLIRAVALACPVVRKMSIAHGRKYMSSADLKRADGCRPALPTLSISDWSANVSETIETMTLRDMEVSRLDDEPTRPLPKLSELRLENCPGGEALAAALVERCASLHEKACIVTSRRAR